VHLDDTPVVERHWYSRGDADGMTYGVEVPLDLGSISSGSVLRIAVGIGARISGVLEGKPGRATPSLAFVFLVPEGKRSWEDSLRITAGADGAYAIHGIPPGKYRLLAREAFDSAGDEKWFEKEVARAETIEFHEGDHVDKNFKPAATAATKEAGSGKPRP
jgi:hypothetical protein